ncbi:MAG: ATP-binding protein [Desulfobacterales bacterium]
MSRRERLPSKGFRSPLMAVALIAVSILAAGGVLAHQAAREIEAVVSEQFNGQQLVIARNIRRLIERALLQVEKELQLTADALVETDDAGIHRRILHDCFPRVLEAGVQVIELLDPGRGSIRTFTAFAETEERSLSDMPVASRMALPEDAAAVIISEPLITDSGISLAVGRRLGREDLRSLVFTVNVSWFLSPFLKDLRSGRTGYAWIIDSEGRFLFHPNADFVGKDAFTIRRSTEPEGSFAAINFIQKERMLKGDEGTGWYTSTWHRGISGRLQKLIAYSPIVVSESPTQRWSVAVVAPLSEIEDEVHRGARRQLFIQGLVVAAIVLVAACVLFFEIRWSRRLEGIVAMRTEALRRSEEQYRSLVESAEDFIFAVDEEGCFLSMNSFTAAFFGDRPSAFIGKPLSCIFPGPSADQQLEVVQRVFREGKSIRREMEVPMGHDPTWLSANFMPIRTDDGCVGSVLCIARDITENKTLERQLVNTEKLASLGTLAAGVAHEINNPLGVILGFCDLLIRKSEPGTQMHDDLKTIERQGFHAKDIVENLLSFARFGGEDRNYADLNACLGDIIRVVRHGLDIKRIELSTEYDRRIPSVRGDARHLQQVFLNLINNASAAIGSDGRIRVRTRLERGGRAVITFQDDGPGIAPADMDHIFEPFFTTKPEGEGTGLGLFVSYGIISRYGGTLECTSPAPGSGSSAGALFTIRLPIHQEEA